MKKNNKKIDLFNTINTTFMLIFAISIIYPFYFCIILAFNDGFDSLIPGMYLWPRKPTLVNFDFIFMSSNFLIAFRNSVARTVLGSTSAVAIIFTGAYGLYNLKLFRKVYVVYFLIPMYISGGLIPVYLVIKSLGLIDNFLVYIVPSMWSFFSTLLFIAYFRGNIDRGIEESAYMDGATPFRTMISIIFPVCKPILATVTLFAAVGQWNGWFDTVIYTKSDNLETLQSRLMRLIKEAENIQMLITEMASKGQNVDFLLNQLRPNGIRVATMLVVITPIICVYPFLQRYFVKGVMIGSLKG